MQPFFADRQELARKSCRLWLANPFHPSLQFKPVEGDLWSARVGLHYRTVGVFLDGAFVLVSPK
jgi:hypothetical protein